jgi:hypothetical protein
MGGGPKLLAIHQLSICYTDRELFRETITHYCKMGYDKWSYDNPTFTGMFRGQPLKAKTLLAFNYQLFGGFEFEMMCNDGAEVTKNFSFTGRLPERGAKTFVSHCSMHVDDLDAQIARMQADQGMNPVFVFETSNHTNPALAGHHHFREATYDTFDEFGYDLKFIQRVPEGGGNG